MTEREKIYVTNVATCDIIKNISEMTFAEKTSFSKQ